MKALRLADIRRFIKKLEILGVTISRPKHSAVPAYNQRAKTIVIPKRFGKSRRFKIPVIALYHEGGHALSSSAFDETTLNVLASIERFKHNHRYSRLLGSLLIVSENVEVVKTQKSEKIKIIETYRKLRRSLFLEMQANSKALKELPAAFAPIYNAEVFKYFELYRKQLLNCRYVSSRPYFCNLLRLTKFHYFKN